MSEKQEYVPRSESLPKQVIAHLLSHNVLVADDDKGSMESALMQAAGRGGPDERVASLLAFLDGPGGRRYLNPERQSPVGQSDLRAVLHALPIRSGHLDDLVSKLALSANEILDGQDDLVAAGLPAADARSIKFKTMARHVVRALDGDHRESWLAGSEPELPVGESLVLATLRRYAGHLKPGAIASTARQWGKELGARYAGDELDELVRTRLAMSHYASNLTRDGQPLRFLYDELGWTPQSPDPEPDAPRAGTPPPGRRAAMPPIVPEDYQDGDPYHTLRNSGMYGF